LIEIDGSYGEGGGQILRNTIALSTLLKKPVKVTNIRSNRPNPGMKAQHYVTIKILKTLCDAEVSGLEIGSDEITYKPGKISEGKYKFEIGTAGSITLAYQACILGCLNIKKPVTITLSGGTDVKWSPSWDYFENVYLKLLEKMGVKVISDLILRGYYPKGGGEANITIKPVERLQGLQTIDNKDYSEIKGNINISNLPDHITKRIKRYVIKESMNNEFLTDINIDKSTSLSPGVGVTLWSDNNKSVLGSSVLGEKGFASEDVGLVASNNIFKEINSSATLDIYGFDQLLPFMVIAKKHGKSNCKIREITSHASTNMWLLQKFFDVDFKAVQNEKNIEITVN